MLEWVRGWMNAGMGMKLGKCWNGNETGQMLE